MKAVKIERGASHRVLREFQAGKGIRAIADEFATFEFVVEEAIRRELGRLRLKK